MQLTTEWLKPRDCIDFRIHFLENECKYQNMLYTLFVVKIMRSNLLYILIRGRRRIFKINAIDHQMVQVTVSAWTSKVVFWKTSPDINVFYMDFFIANMIYNNLCYIKNFVKRCIFKINVIEYRTV